MTLEQLFPILMQYAPVMLDAVQNRGYDPETMIKNAGDMLNYWYGRGSFDSYLSQVNDPADLADDMDTVDYTFNQYLKDSDNPRNVNNYKNDGSDLVYHEPEYPLEELTPLGADESSDMTDYFLKGPNNKLSALGYAKQMAYNGAFSEDPESKNLIALYNKLNKKM